MTKQSCEGPLRLHIFADFLLFWKYIINQTSAERMLKEVLVSFLEMGA